MDVGEWDGGLCDKLVALQCSAVEETDQQYTIVVHTREDQRLFKEPPVLATGRLD